MSLVWAFNSVRCVRASENQISMNPYAEFVASLFRNSFNNELSNTKINLMKVLKIINYFN